MKWITDLYWWTRTTVLLSLSQAGDPLKDAFMYFAGSKSKETLNLQVYKDKAGEHRWRLVSANGRILCISSEGYSSRQALNKSLKLIKTYMKDAPIK